MIRRLIKQPYQVLPLAAIMFFVAGLFNFHSTVDIHLYDTYYILPLAHYIWIPAIILFIFWLIYLMVNGMLFSHTLTRVHIIFTILGCIFILTIPFQMTDMPESLAGFPRRYIDIGQSHTYRIMGHLKKAALFQMYVLLLAQLILPVNLIVGLYRRTSVS